MPMVVPKMLEMMVWSGVLRRPDDDPLLHRRLAIHTKAVEEEEEQHENAPAPVKPQEFECPLYC
jgi:hypothetical protein